MKESNYKVLNSIKTWAEADRPREKLLTKGKHVLSDAELLAILIGSGSSSESAVALCQRILKSVEYNLHELGKLRVSELQKFKGIGEAKAVSIVAALELGKRRQASPTQKRITISCSRDCYMIFHPILGDLPHEEFWILLLNRANRVLSKKRLSSGGISGTVADSRLIFKEAIESLASSIIVCHNHPSGNRKPSHSDINLTEKLVKAGKLLEIAVLDHLIVTENGYYSFADEGRIG